MTNQHHNRLLKGNIRILILSFTVVLSLVCQAQAGSFPRDTSFTVFSSFIKEQKKFPFIRVADPPRPGNILSDSNVVYKTIGNRQLHADVFYPSNKSSSSYPGVVLIHGGGWRSGDRSQTHAIAQQLASKGYVAAAIEYRLSLEAAYPAAVHDVKAFVKWLRRHAASYHLDKNKIASMGFSSGGQMAALIGTTNGLSRFDDAETDLKTSSDIQAIIDVDGILAFKHPESEEGAVAAAWLGGPYDTNAAIWNEASALTHVDKNTPPILFINSSLPRFHAGRDDMIRKMDVFKIYSEVHMIPNTPHPFWFFDPWFDEVVRYTLGFLDKVFSNHRFRKSLRKS